VSKADTPFICPVLLRSLSMNPLQSGLLNILAM